MKLDKNMFNRVSSSKRTPKGSAGYDNARENIDPHVKTKVVDQLEGSVQKVPAVAKDIVNKEYVDSKFPVTHVSTTGRTATDHHDNSDDHASGSDDQVSGDFVHNSLVGLNAGDSYEHITAVQKAALHVVYTDAEAVAAVLAADDYIKNVGDVGTGSYTLPTIVCTNLSATNLEADLDGTGYDLTIKDITAVDLDCTGRISSNTLVITTANDGAGIDVSGVNILFIDSSGGDITISDFASGIDGQIIYMTIKDTTSITVIQNETGNNQELVLHDAGDVIFGGGDRFGFIFVCNGSKWYDVSHSKHV